MNKKLGNDITVVAIYIRVSSDEQARHGYSLNSQRERLIQFAKDNKYKVFKIYADEGKSARSKLNQRTALLELLEDAQNNKFDKIIFWRLDRWFRNIQDYYKIQEVLDKHNVTWECSDEEYNTSTSNGRLHLNIKLSIAQNESDQTSDRIKFNFDNMVKNKLAIFSSVPPGYIVKDKKVIIDEEKREMITDLFSYFEQYQSLKKAHKHIIDNYQTNISYNSVSLLFKNTLYYGEYRGVQDFCEAYITKEQFIKNQDIISKNLKVRKYRHTYIFSGLLICPICGHRLAGFFVNQKDKNDNIKYYFYYRCENAFTQRRCHFKSIISEKKLNKYLLNEIISLIEQEIININIAEAEKAKRKKPIDRNKIKNKMDKLVDLYLDGIIDKTKYQNDYNRLKDELDKVDTVEIKDKKRDLSKYEELKASNALELYTQLDNEHKRLFWRNIIDRIVIDKDFNHKVYLK
jgi:DNA invertase Pin-like site-specific DNA recombinase